MRTDKKIGENVIVTFIGDTNKIFIRRSGNVHRDDYESLLKIENDTLKIHKDIADKYGINIEFAEPKK